MVEVWLFPNWALCGSGFGALIWQFFFPSFSLLLSRIREFFNFGKKEGGENFFFPWRGPQSFFSYLAGKINWGPLGTWALSLYYCFVSENAPPSPVSVGTNTAAECFHRALTKQISAQRRQNSCGGAPRREK